MNVYSEVLLMRDAGAITRSHTLRRVFTHRNVAEHSYGVAMLILLLYRHDGGAMPPAALLAAALAHDLSEIATGDVPAPVKRDNPELKAELNRITTAWEEKHHLRFGLSVDEQALLKWCDNAEFALYALEEVTAGNRFFMVYLERIINWLERDGYPNCSYKIRSGCEDIYTAIRLRANYLGKVTTI
jgi:5'-deoxynucleotidase